MNKFIKMLRINNRFIVTIIILSLYATLGAQELSIKSFEPNTRDLAARSNPRLDNNDVPCALVKVHLASADAIFEGSVIGNVEYKTGEYWVYMPNGSKRLTVKLEGYLPLYIEFPTVLESKVTYVLTISGVFVSGQQPQEVRTKTGWIILESEPSGAAVYINGEFVGNTPLDSYKQPYGRYTYRLEKPNYHNASGVVELNSSKYEENITLSPAFGAVKVSSNVTGAIVLLDGKNTGHVTPCTLNEIASGEHTVSLQKEKYAPMQYKVTVEDGQVAIVNGNLDARFATINVKTLQGADIYIDNTKKGTSEYVQDLMEGYYDIEVSLAHHKPVTKQIQVIAGQSQTVEVRPTPIYGSLDVTSTPRGADVKIDGKDYGKTPISVEKLLEGEHTVEYTLAGYAKEVKQVSISEGQIATSSVVLSVGRDVTIRAEYDGAKLFVDGKVVGTTPYIGLLAYGHHTVYAVYGDKMTKEEDVSVEQGNEAMDEIMLTFETRENGYEYIDLGLSVKWATYNVGATKPEELGEYYAWGETATKSVYCDDNYKWLHKGGQWKGFYAIKYFCGIPKFGRPDYLTILEPQDDVAHVKWGGQWRMPTAEEWEELKRECIWTITSLNGVKGYKVASKVNGKHIFIPKTNSSRDGKLWNPGGYWTSSSCKIDLLYASYSECGETEFCERYYGKKVRPVCP